MFCKFQLPLFCPGLPLTEGCLIVSKVPLHEGSRLSPDTPVHVTARISTPYFKHEWQRYYLFQFSLSISLSSIETM